MYEDLAGRRFGRLIVLEQAPSAKSGGTLRRQWRCVCDCGAETVAPTNRLKVGGVRSCGCLARDMAVERRRLFDEARALGFETSSPTWSVWRGLVLRATIAITDSAAVRIDPRWLGPGGFAHFIADMGERPSSDHHLDRVDPDGTFAAANCVWTTERSKGAAAA